MFSLLFLAFFLLAAVLNLIASRKNNTLYFAVTKPMLLLLLCLYCFSAGGQSPDLLLIGAFFACWLGDVLLMPEGNVWFITGGISFLAGHVLLILIFARYVEFGCLPLPFLIPAALAYAVCAGLVMFRAKKKAPKLMQIPMLLYLLANGAMNTFALSRLCISPGIWQAVSYIGALLFFLSDCALFLMRYDSGKPRFFKTGFFVMLTYITGVLLIALGLVPITG